MTKSPLPGEFEFSDDDLALFGCVERVSEPGELIAAIPALLGFHPSNSVVALALMGTSASTLGPVMRHDYFPSVRGKPARQMSAALRQFAAVCNGERARAVVLVVITDCSAAETLIDETIELAEEFEDILGGTCVELADVLCTAAIECGQPWTSVTRSIHRGTLPDPASSSVAAAQVLGGRVIRRSREELVRWVHGAARNHEVIAELIASGRESGTYVGGVDGDGPVQGRVDLVLRHIRRVEGGDHPDPQECADLVVALTDVHVRDVVLGLAITSVAAAAEQLWLVLTHEVPSPEPLGRQHFSGSLHTCAVTVLWPVLRCRSHCRPIPNTPWLDCWTCPFNPACTPTGSVTLRPSDCPSGNRSESPACRRHCRAEASEQRVSDRPDPGGTATHRRR
ncbi:DUF4192 domain-containing protein [Rhodococcus erythropolis]|nr:DUF4192 domain-containing protein [Rhodococcus erythropolis]MBT2267357.1 DUF4192 domain-containing protein [Rhodococcus erythropolis]